MKPHHFITALDESRIHAAIKDAHAKSTGHIGVLVSKRPAPDPLAAAEKHFHARNLHHAPHRNAILIFVAPKSHTFAIVGDAAIHAQVGPDFWTTLRDEMTPHLKEAHYTEALLHAITKAGDLLAQHFPRKDS